MGLNLKPLADRVVVEPAPAEDKSAGGIILPDTAQEKPQQGTVTVSYTHLTLPTNREV